MWLNLRIDIRYNIINHSNLESLMLILILRDGNAPDLMPMRRVECALSDCREIEMVRVTLLVLLAATVTSVSTQSERK